MEMKRGDTHYMISEFNEFQLNIIYSSRKSIAIELKLGAITIRAPKGMSRRDINVFLESKRGWIEKHLSKMQERQEALEQVEPFTMDKIHEPLCGILCRSGASIPRIPQMPEVVEGKRWLIFEPSSVKIIWKNTENK